MVGGGIEGLRLKIPKEALKKFRLTGGRTGVDTWRGRGRILRDKSPPHDFFFIINFIFDPTEVKTNDRLLFSVTTYLERYLIIRHTVKNVAHCRPKTNLLCLSVCRGTH